MTIYQRIKNRRKELGLTADAVAQALGVSRATVYRYESSEIEKLPTAILEPLAKILQTTPSYLMGWQSSPVSEEPDGSDRAVITGFGENGDRVVKELSEEQFARVMKFLEALDGDNKNI